MKHVELQAVRVVDISTSISILAQWATCTGSILCSEFHEEVYVMDESAPRLAKRLRTLKSDTRHAILIKACLFSAVMMGPLDAEVQGGCFGVTRVAVELSGVLRHAPTCSLATMGRRPFSLAKDGNLPMLLEQFRHKGPLGVIELAG
jgi:hypothetical protein